MQGTYWLLTIPSHCFIPYLPDGVNWVIGQLERGVGGFLHWQILCSFSRSVRLARVKSVFGDQVHAELSRSSAAEAYVQKEATRIEGTGFELGKKPFKRNSKRDWDGIWELAKSGNNSFLSNRSINQLLRQLGLLF